MEMVTREFSANQTEYGQYVEKRNHGESFSKRAVIGKCTRGDLLAEIGGSRKNALEELGVVSQRADTYVRWRRDFPRAGFRLSANAWKTEFPKA